MGNDLMVREQHQALAAPIDAGVLEKVLVTGDLSALKPQERLSYYDAVCTSLRLNPLTQPFAYVMLNNKLTLYARKECTDQLRSIRNVSATLGDHQIMDGIVFIRAHVKLPNGRTDEATGAVNIENLKGEAKANAFMKCETKAKRRATLSICGLGMPDESELESIPDARLVTIEDAHGDKPLSLAPSSTPKQNGAPAAAAKPAPPPATSAPGTEEERAIAELIRRCKTGEPPTADVFHCATVIGGLKADLNEDSGTDHAYYEVLKQHGLEHTDPKEKAPKGLKGLSSLKVFALIRDLYRRHMAIRASLEPPVEGTVPLVDGKTDWLPGNLGGRDE